MTVNLPLLLAVAAFALFLMWKFRPAFGRREADAGRAVLAEAKRRAATAIGKADRAAALCDAGEACLRTLGGRRRAPSFFLRAMRTDPQSALVIRRASSALAKHPRSLESLLWRRLSAEPCTGETRAASEAVLENLVALYSGRLNNPVRANALKNALEALRS